MVVGVMCVSVYTLMTSMGLDVGKLEVNKGHG